MTRFVLTVLPAPDSPKKGFGEVDQKSIPRESRFSKKLAYTKKQSELTSNQHGLIVTFSQHVIVSIIRNGENVWRHFRLSLALVTSDNVIVIYWKPLVRVYSNTEETLIYIELKLVKVQSGCPHRCGCQFGWVKLAIELDPIILTVHGKPLARGEGLCDIDRL